MVWECDTTLTLPSLTHDPVIFCSLNDAVSCRIYHRLRSGIFEGTVSGRSPKDTVADVSIVAATAEV